MDLIKNFFVADKDVVLEDIIYFPIFDLLQCSTCNEYILTYAGANYHFHVAKNHYGALKKINAISLFELRNYKIKIYYPEELEELIRIYLERNKQDKN